MHIRGISTVSVLIIILLLAFLSSPAPVHAANITLSPTSGTVGSSILISGNGFAGRSAAVHWDNQIVLTKIPISETGELTCTLKVPTACKGSHTIKVTDDSNWTSSTASATFTVLPQITIFPRIGRTYTPVTVIGTGFAPFERDIRITWDGNILHITAATNHLGTWSINFDIPETTKGDHFISALSPSTKASEIGEVKFIVAPVAKIEPVSGPVGTEIKIDGFGFRTGEDGITITWDGDIIMCNIVGGSDGSWNAALNIPPSTQGYHTIGVYGSSFTPRGIVPDTKFNIVPHIELQPSSGNRGAKVTIEGTGFAKDEAITIDFNEIKLDVAVVTGNTGSFNAKFEVPPSMIRENTITATGNKGNSAQAVFTTEKVIPPAPKLLSPEQGVKLEILDSVGDVFFETAKRLIEIITFSTQRSSGAPQTSFTWLDSGKPGDVSYVLQIAREDNFSSPTLAEESLVDPNYTLSHGDTLAPGNYSWRVKVVDDIGNESPWSEVQQFEVIPMSRRALILSLVIPVFFIAAIAAGGILIWRLRKAKR